MTKVFFDPECGAILARKLAETETAARAALTACTGDCAQGRICGCGPAAALNSREGCAGQADDPPTKREEPAIKLALGLVAWVAFMVAVLRALALTLPTPIDRPAAQQPAASVPAASVT